MQSGTRAPKFRRNLLPPFSFSHLPSAFYRWFRRIADLYLPNYEYMASDTLIFVAATIANMKWGNNCPADPTTKQADRQAHICSLHSVCVIAIILSRQFNSHVGIQVAEIIYFVQDDGKHKSPLTNHCQTLLNASRSTIFSYISIKAMKIETRRTKPASSKMFHRIRSQRWITGHSDYNVYNGVVGFCEGGNYKRRLKRGRLQRRKNFFFLSFM